jgi:hypothetical protein
MRTVLGVVGVFAAMVASSDAVSACDRHVGSEHPGYGAERRFSPLARLQTLVPEPDFRSVDAGKRAEVVAQPADKERAAPPFGSDSDKRKTDRALSAEPSPPKRT